MTEDEYRFDEWMSELYAEHSKEALEEFTAERLQSYYLRDPQVAKSPMGALSQARLLLPDHASPAFVFATVAIEVGIKVALLKPIVHGLVHNNSAASLITDLVIRHGGDRYRDLLFHVLSDVGGIDFRKFRRAESDQLLWEEINWVQKTRNAIVHRAEEVTVQDAGRSVSVASMILEQVFPAVVNKLGLHLHEGVRVCNEWQCGHKSTIEVLPQSL